jgi:hypothetical protein
MQEGIGWIVDADVTGDVFNAPRRAVAAEAVG